MSDAINAQWAHSVEMYRKWKLLDTPNAIRMAQMHRDRFPKQAKIFDQIDMELSTND